MKRELHVATLYFDLLEAASEVTETALEVATVRAAMALASGIGDPVP